MNREIHPAADLFPMMSPSDLSELTADISRNGLLEPIVLCEGKILDGRNRLVACELANVEPRFVDVNGDAPSPVLYVLAKNLHRRHLTVSQRAAIAAEAVPILEHEAKNRMLAGTLAPVGAKGKSAEIAAKEVQASERSVERAIAIKKADPALFEKVKAGEVTAYTAYERIPKKVREAANTDSPKRVLGNQRPDTQKQNLVTGLSTITGLCRGLEEVNVPLALSLCDPTERKLWARRARELANKLRKFAVRLEAHDAECS